MSASPTGHVTTQYFVWQCLKCGYALVAKDPPERCPDCGALRDQFVPIEED